MACYSNVNTRSINFFFKLTACTRSAQGVGVPWIKDRNPWKIPRALEFQEFPQWISSCSNLVWNLPVGLRDMRACAQKLFSEKFCDAPWAQKGVEALADAPRSDQLNDFSQGARWARRGGRGRRRAHAQWADASNGSVFCRVARRMVQALLASCSKESEDEKSIWNSKFKKCSKN